MLKVPKSILFIIIISVILSSCTLNKKTPEDTYGNTIGNFSSLGWVVEGENAVYIANKKDDETGKIIKISNDDRETKVISNKLATGLNMYKNNLYFVNETDYFIYRINEDDKEDCMYDKEGVYFLHIVNDYFYFISEDLHLKRLRIGQNDAEIIVDQYVNAFAVHNGKIYYSTVTENYDPGVMCTANLDGSQSIFFYDGCTQFINISNDRIYFTDTKQGNKLITVNMEGKDKIVLNSNKSFCPIVSDDKIFYLTLEDEIQKLYSMSLDGKDKKRLVDQQIYGIQMSSNRIYYFTASADKTAFILYMMNKDGTNIQEIPF